MKGEEPILSDFGTVRALHEELRVNKDPDEMSPRPFTRTILSSEQVRDEPYGVPVDIWGLGLILYQMIYGIHPFVTSKEIESQRNIDEMRFQKPDVEPLISPVCKELIYSMLQKDPEKRITWDDLINHKVLNPEFSYANPLLSDKI